MSASPAWLRLHVSGHCNYACPHCHVFEGAAERPAAGFMSAELMEESLRAFLAALPSGDKGVVSFYGGEPLLNAKNIFRFLEAGAEHASRISWVLNTNASLISAESAATLARFGVDVHVSCDGEGDTHERSRPAKNRSATFPALIAGLEKLRAAGARVQLNTYLNPVNEDRIGEVISVARRFGVKRIYLDLGHGERAPGEPDARRILAAVYEAAGHGIVVTGPWLEVVARAQGRRVEKNPLEVEVSMGGGLSFTGFPAFRSPRLGLAALRDGSWAGLRELASAEARAGARAACAGCRIEAACQGRAIQQEEYHFGRAASACRARPAYEALVAHYAGRLGVKREKDFVWLTSLPFEELAPLRAELERGLAFLREELGEANGQVSVAVMAGQHELRALAGCPLPGWARSVALWPATVAIAGAEKTDGLVHELSHAYSWLLHGKRAPLWLEEGVAELLQAKFRGRQVPATPLPGLPSVLGLEGRGVRGLLDHSELPPPANPFYAQAARFTSFLVQECGWEEVRALYRNAEAGSGSGDCELRGRSLAAWEAAWQ